MNLYVHVEAARIPGPHYGSRAIEVFDAAKRAWYLLGHREDGRRIWGNQRPRTTRFEPEP